MFKWFLKRMKKNNKGFTLVELVVVIAILGILAAIAVPKFNASRENAAITAHNANVRTLISAANMYLADGNEGTTWKDEDEYDSWKTYLQSWPEIPGELKGKSYNMKDKDNPYEIKDDEKYVVNIDSNGEITVEPGEIIKPAD